MEKPASAYNGFILRTRAAFKMDTHCEEVVAWDEEKQRPVYYTNGQGSEVQRVDASEETIAKYYEWQNKENERIAANEAQYDLQVLEKGKTVRIVGSKRVKNVGEQGVVIDIFRTQHYTTVYLINASGTRVKSYETNLEIQVGEEWKPIHSPRKESRQGITCHGTY